MIDECTTKTIHYGILKKDGSWATLYGKPFSTPSIKLASMLLEDYRNSVAIIPESMRDARIAEMEGDH